MPDKMVELGNSAGFSESYLDELIVRARAGCDCSREQLFTRLFQELQDRITACVGKGQGTPSRSASDFAQETWLRIARRFHEDFKGENYRQLCRWAMSTLSGEFLNARRRAARRREFHRDIWRCILASQEKDNDGRRLIDLTIREDELRRAEACVQRLSPGQQMTLRLRLWEKRTFVEIATHLGVHEKTVRQRYRVAIAQLQRMFYDGER